ncbi:MAG: glycosyltransferase family 2 protein [Magnetococcales bacterium]|nr:glycosyltransferase family 2 protein [Magnetococcales bacterium]
METVPGMIRTATPDRSAPRVTVLTSVFNGARFLDEAIGSIHRQSCGDFEYLLIDDASTDATPTLLATWAERDPRIRVIRNETNLGLTRSLNKGIHLARAPWIARQDADDWSHPERLAKQLAHLETHPEIGLLGCAAWWMDPLGQREAAPRVNPVDHEEIAWTLLFHNPFFHTSVLFSRALVRTHPYDEAWRFGQDFELWGRLSRHTRCANLAEPLVCIRRHEERVSARHFQSQQASTLELTASRCRALCPELTWDPERLQTLRSLQSSRWATSEESPELHGVWLRLFQAFAQQEGLDRRPLDALRQQVLQRSWRAVIGMTNLEARWSVIREMGRVAGAWESFRALGILMGRRAWRAMAPDRNAP